ncbi:hypothetical protein SNEBB_004212 [Seison nebaliae]|nr:hypothetical protein SNEBB_004212 [Seison nebaliae]
MELIGSKYNGPYVNGRIEGEGYYILPNGSQYLGGFKDGKWHGNGTLLFNNGGRFEGRFDNGKSISGKYIFADDLEYEVDDGWKYCNGYDRRFHKEILPPGIRPAGLSLITNELEPRDIPNGQFDIGEGFYDPSKKIVFTYDGNFLRHSTEEEDKWIVGKCRKNIEEVMSEKKNEMPNQQ